MRPLSPHLERAFGFGFDSLPEEARDHKRDDAAALLAAFPLDRSKADRESIAYAENPGARDYDREPPYEAFMHDRELIHRHMRLAFEEDADWLVEMLELEREAVAAQAAYDALALDGEAGMRPAWGNRPDAKKLRAGVRLGRPRSLVFWEVCWSMAGALGTPVPLP